MRNITKSFTSALIFISNLALANPVHTWHHVSTTEGVWDARLQMINEGGMFVTKDGSTLTDFTVTSSTPMEYGFAFDEGDDFNVAYTLTLTQRDTGVFRRFSNKACVFVITAAGPAQPDIHASNYNGAKCSWKVVKGYGEDFFTT